MLYEEYANQIFRYCLHQLGSREEAEDAVQSTFLNAFRGIQRGVVPEIESAWLFKIAHNVCLSRRRSSWRRGRVESPTDFEVVEELTPAPSRRADELIGLQDVLEQMPESQRRAILLREWQGLSYREIAGELELSQAAVETLIFRARRALAVGLERPPERMKRRVVRGFDPGNVIAGLKAVLVGGSAAAKVAATVAVVSATTVVAADPVVQRHHHTQHSQPARPVVHEQPARTSQNGTASVAAPVMLSAVQSTPVRHPLRAVHRAAPVQMSRPVEPSPAEDGNVVVRFSLPAPAEAAAVQHPAPVSAAAPALSVVEGDAGLKADQKQKGEKANRDDSRHSSAKLRHGSPLPPVPVSGESIGSPGAAAQDSGPLTGLAPVQQPAYKTDHRNIVDESS